MEFQERVMFLIVNSLLSSKAVGVHEISSIKDAAFFK